ncbi:reticulon-4 receptor-like 1 [Brienomyrus brachyistius]|uniref:reticulon-4 receptor-like 1 n=1 Tax=Brienomyrus brachyistius TaxID=42636 RepID=UPI0020B26291|nr:reticulon-4 receptor-like 1 [Brienomyrus brachyistius]
MFQRGCRLEFLLVLWGLELSWACPRDCVCYTTPSTVSCQAHNFLSVPEGIPAESERIFLQNNRIGQLLRGHFSPAAIMLWLYSNDISYIEPTTFHGFFRLEELDLGDNRHLRALAPDTFHGLGRLNALHLYRCGLSTLPSGIFQGLHNLQYLYLQDNHLDFLEDDLFVDLLNLSHLFLHGNRLWSLHQNTFRGLGALDRLLLHHNRLQWVDRLAFHDLRRLTTLYLFNNSLTQLPAECLAQLPALEYLRLNDNPWDCGCRALPLWDWLRRFRGSTSEVGCHEPPGLAGRDLKRLRQEELPSCVASESRHQSSGHFPHLPHRDQHHLIPPPSPLPRPLPSARPGRPRNCTRQRGRWGKGKGLNEAHISREMDKEYSYPNKHDLDNPDGSGSRRKHKCAPRTTVGPPSGVQRATSGGAAAFRCSLLLLLVMVGLLEPLSVNVLR